MFPVSCSNKNSIPILTYLLTNPLPTKLALDRILNDSIIAQPRIHIRNDIQREPHADEIEDFVEECAIHGNQSAFHASRLAFIRHSRISQSELHLCII